MIERLALPTNVQLSTLADLHARAFTRASRSWSAEEISDLAAQGSLFVGPYAFALFSKVLDEAELLTIAVDPDHQRQGAGRRLLAAAEAALAAEGVMRSLLEVAADNDGAIALYLQAGYNIVGQRKTYYDRGVAGRVDAIMMAKML